MKHFATSLVLLLALTASASTPAIFRGRVVQVANQAAGTIFVMGRNGSLRKVEIGRARVLYADEIPQKLRRARPSESLKHGADVRVEAEENGHGVWRARSIEILSLPGSPSAQARPKSPKEQKPPSGPVLSRRG